MWNFEAIENLGATLWPFSFDDSVRQLLLGTLFLVPNLGKEYTVYREKKRNQKPPKSLLIYPEMVPETKKHKTKAR